MYGISKNGKTKIMFVLLITLLHVDLTHLTLPTLRKLVIQVNDRTRDFFCAGAVRFWDFKILLFGAVLRKFPHQPLLVRWSLGRTLKYLFNLKKAHTIVSKVAIGPTVAKFLDEGQGNEFWDAFRTIAAEKSKQKFNYLCLDFKRQLLLLRRL